MANYSTDYYYIGLAFEVPRSRCIEVVNFYVNTLQSLSLQCGDDDDDGNYDGDGTR